MTEDHRQNPKLLWGIVAALVLAIAVFFGFSQWILLNNESTPVHQEEALVKATTKAEPARPAQPTTAETPPQVLIDETVLSAPISENATLAEEELAKLTDLQNQLIAQQQSLNAQHRDADQLMQLKQQQLKLLEAQLAAQ
jgi:hypothetical protein